MTRISWDESGSRVFETGVDRGVLYPSEGSGVPWNGLSAVREAAGSVESSQHHIDGLKYRDRVVTDAYSATIEAFTYPDEFLEYDGYSEVGEGLSAPGRKRKGFNLCYRTRVGNEHEGADYGYKLHLVYNATATPSNRDYLSISDASDPVAFSWDLVTVPVSVPGSRAGSHFIIDSTVAWPGAMEAIEDILYGDDENEPRFPTVDEIIEIFQANALLLITDNGDGTWTADTDEEGIITMLDEDTFEISWPSAVYISDISYTLTSL